MMTDFLLALFVLIVIWLALKPDIKESLTFRQIRRSNASRMICRE